MSTTVTIDIALPAAVLAMGGELKNTICYAKEKTAWISEPFDDLKDATVFNAYCDAVRSVAQAHGGRPSCLAYDLHPEYLSHKVAMRGDIWPGVPRMGIQHHEAHVASCAASENILQDVIGLAFDGTGYGTDGTMWGGEFFSGSVLEGFTRQGRLKPLVLPGGEAAIREPWRLAAALEYAAMPERFGTDSIVKKQLIGVSDETWDVVTELLTGDLIPVVISSSIGRLFDGVSALLGLSMHAAAEAEAAIALEKAAGAEQPHRIYTLDITEAAGGLLELDWTEMVREIIGESTDNVDMAYIAAAFHDSLALATAEMCAEIAGERTTVLCSGGVFWNKRFSTSLKSSLEEKGMRMVTPTRVPPSDAGLSLGQAVLASYAMNRAGKK